VKAMGGDQHHGRVGTGLAEQRPEHQVVQAIAAIHDVVVEVVVLLLDRGELRRRARVGDCDFEENVMATVCSRSISVTLLSIRRPQ